MPQSQNNDPIYVEIKNKNKCRFANIAVNNSRSQTVTSQDGNAYSQYLQVRITLWNTEEQMNTTYNQQYQQETNSGVS